MVERPRGLEVVLHALLELLGHGVQNREVLEVPPFRLIDRLALSIQPLHQNSHVPKDSGME